MMGKTVIMVIAMRMVVVEDALVADPLSAAAVSLTLYVEILRYS